MLFESKTDREYEELFTDYMGLNYKVEARKIDKKYGPDFFVTRPDGSPQSWMEFKQRDAKILGFSTYMISAYKIWRGRSIADSTGLQFVLAIGVEEDETITYRSAEITPEVIAGSWLSMGGRKDRGYAGDMEPTYFIPWAYFQAI